MESGGVIDRHSAVERSAIPRVSKSAAISLAVRLTPQYAEALRDLQRGNCRFQFQPRIAALRDRIGGYVRLYEKPMHFELALFVGLFGEEGLKQLNAASASWSAAEQRKFLDEFASSGELEQALDEMYWPETEEEWKEVEAQALALPPEEQQALYRQSVFWWSGVFGIFFDTVSLMVHGAKLSALVVRAISGDTDAFLKAVQMDRLLISHHPYFRHRRLLAQETGDLEFLAKLAYRERNPPLRGKIAYPALYMLFGILESVRWLDDLKHNEILDVCDAAGLHRYQNRIEDVNYLTKRLREYRRWQKTGTVSMH